MSKNRPTVYFEGVEGLLDKLESNIAAKAIPEIIKANATEMNKNMQNQAKVKLTGHYKNGKLIKPTGMTRRRTTTVFDLNGWKSTTGPKTHYSPFLIYGTRYMAKRDFFRPAFRVQRIKFKKDMERLVE